MAIIPPLQPTLPLSGAQTVLLNSAAVKSMALQIGQQLQATVLSNQNGQLQLKTPQGVLNSHTQLPLPPGQSLTLTVTQLEPKITLSLLPPATPPVDGFLQRIAPQQQSLQQMLHSLSQQLQNSNVTTNAKGPIEQLFQQLPTLLQLFNPKMVEQKIGQSGAFLESHLLSKKSTLLKGDLKQQLLQIRERLLNQPNQQKLVQQIESMIARIELGQLKSLQQSQLPDQRSWIIELPFLLNEKPESIELHLRHHRKGESSNEESWQLQLTLHPPELGEIRTSIRWHHEQIDIHFLTETQESATLIQGHLEKLEAALSVAGIDVGTLLSRQQTSLDDTSSIDTIETGFTTQA